VALCVINKYKEMNLNYDNLKSFFDRIKSLSFWQRVFYWSAMKSLSYDAYEEFKAISDNIDTLSRQITDRDARIGDQENIQIMSARVTYITSANQKLENRIASLDAEIKRISSEKNEMAGKITRFEQTEQSRSEEFQKNVYGVNAIRTGLENDRQKINDERVKEKEDSFEQMKQTWRNHEEAVKTAIKNM
jgi:chromosome segregation ATPase